MTAIGSSAIGGCYHIRGEPDELAGKLCGFRQHLPTAVAIVRLFVLWFYVRELASQMCIMTF